MISSGGFQGFGGNSRADSEEPSVNFMVHLELGKLPRGEIVLFSAFVFGSRQSLELICG